MPFGKLLPKAWQVSNRNLPVLPSVQLTATDQPTLSETWLISGLGSPEPSGSEMEESCDMNENSQCVWVPPSLRPDSPKHHERPVVDHCNPRMQGELLVWTNDIWMVAYSQTVPWPFTQSASYLCLYFLSRCCRILQGVEKLHGEKLHF